VRIVLPVLRNTGVGATPGGRRDEILDLARRLAADLAPDLLVFPELSAAGYPGLVDEAADEAALSAVAEPLCGPTSQAFGELARASACAIVYGLCEHDPADGKRYNTVVWADPAGSCAGYRKIHLTEQERRHFSAGSESVVIDCGFGRVGLSSCYDKMFPQLYQRQRERGAQISVISSAWSSRPAGPGESGDILAEQSALFDRARAAETGMLVISTNYDGPKLPGCADRFCGGQRVIDGLGRLLEPTVITTDSLVWDVDPVQAAHAVRVFNNGDFFIRDRRLAR
jgi:(R)-amidase